MPRAGFETANPKFEWSKTESVLERVILPLSCFDFLIIYNYICKSEDVFMDNIDINRPSMTKNTYWPIFFI
jgi:hypothetical protein